MIVSFFKTNQFAVLKHFSLDHRVNPRTAPFLSWYVKLSVFGFFSVIKIIVIHQVRSYLHLMPSEHEDNYRLITVYLLLRVNLDKIMRAR